ncbi:MULTISPECIES: OsmC family protein [Porphyromonadaceae]|uniref:OsmC family protein n=1 Tax=Sanguibacteroides justesenii TaxID=1547597 RepID=A0A0C3RIW7_9PORP|nr:MULTISPECIES: OsmC family protein [Porphyromonadaceae]KIO47506.1 OsmC family protein [Sanguibacteroides justesenii]
MTTVKAKYLGDLRLECTHLQSGTTIVTDAPTDNNGKGEAFSPTDLCATSLAACAMTIMGIYAKNNGIDLSGTEIEITKTMAAEPRRIAGIDVIFHMPARAFSKKDKTVLERVAHTCPVHLSLHPDVKQNFVFEWAE